MIRTAIALLRLTLALLRHPLLALAAAAALLLLGSPAYAADGVFTSSVPVPLILQLVITVVLPVLVGLVTRQVTGAHTKALILLGLSILTSGITEFAAAYGDHPFDFGVWLVSALATFIAGVGLHFGLYKPTGVADRAQAAFTRAA